MAYCGLFTSRSTETQRCLVIGKQLIVNKSILMVGEI